MEPGRSPLLIERIFWTTYRGAGNYTLNPAQWAALRFFSEAGSKSRTSSEFAKYHQTTRGTANQTVLALLRRGYLHREKAEHDQRSKVVTLTPKGRDALRQDPIRLLKAAVEKLNHAERLQLDQLLAAVLTGLTDAQAEDKAAGSQSLSNTTE